MKNVLPILALFVAAIVTTSNAAEYTFLKNRRIVRNQKLMRRLRKTAPLEKRNGFGKRAIQVVDGSTKAPSGSTKAPSGSTKAPSGSTKAPTSGSTKAPIGFGTKGPSKDGGGGLTEAPIPFQITNPPAPSGPSAPSPSAPTSKGKTKKSKAPTTSKQSKAPSVDGSKGKTKKSKAPTTSKQSKAPSVDKGKQKKSKAPSVDKGKKKKSKAPSTNEDQGGTDVDVGGLQSGATSLRTFSMASISTFIAMLWFLM